MKNNKFDSTGKMPWDDFIDLSKYPLMVTKGTITRYKVIRDGYTIITHVK